jgi:carotenoid cleavage dioxygenase-like enzyme
MSQPFPTDPFFCGNYAPLSFEADAPDLPVRGELPKDLAGTLYRNGPNPQFAPRDHDHHWFIGDGMIHAFHIADGRVGYRNRWVRTPKWELEHQAHQALFGSWGNPATTDPSAQGKDGGVANTNIVWHAGKLFALEEGHRPFALDPETLAAHGYGTSAARSAAPASLRIRKSIPRPAKWFSSLIRRAGVFRQRWLMA